tara:strand:- start:432 stop:1064 length:633 start_codon:yes stop_codon:yes gene_type:complete
MIRFLRRKLINYICKGWSTKNQWQLFHKIIKENLNIKNLAMLGVYRGRDLAYLCCALKHNNIKNFKVYALDVFDDVPCDDWPEEFKNKSWQEGFSIPPPSLEKSKLIINLLGFRKNVIFIKGDIKELEKIDTKLDFVYIDIAHDYKSTIRAIDISVKMGSENLVLLGDDYADQETKSTPWGVIKAVEESFSKTKIHLNWFWESKKKYYKR